ncbi:hypothetical protein Tco_0893992 [Tanacetum coccineum]|uniref:ETF-QO/FixC ubiquinone-binding domain-containing protein n=1 Tax=Tanacetum coccineum TaxID=301880 RepID=A0ABQ5CAE9_9ASTR
MATTFVSSVEQATLESDIVVSKERLMFLVNQEIMEVALRVEDYKRMARQLKESVRRKCGYIGALKDGPRDVDSNERLKFMERIWLEDMEKGTRLLLMMKETEMKIGEKIDFVTSLGDNVVWEIDGSKHKPGVVVHTLGWPLDHKTYRGHSYTICKIGRFRVREGLDVVTKNVPEYPAVILGLRYALDKELRHILAKESKDKLLSFEICHVAMATCLYLKMLFECEVFTLKLSLSMEEPEESAEFAGREEMTVLPYCGFPARTKVGDAVLCLDCCYRK